MHIFTKLFWLFFIGCSYFAFVIWIFLLPMPKQPTRLGQAITTAEIKRKKILVFNCLGGGGHQSTSTALKTYLNGMYDVEDILTFEEALAPLDPLRTVSFGSYACTDFYNYLLSNQWHAMANVLSRYGNFATNQKNKKITELLQSCIEEKNPDMIISVVPFINQSLYTIAEQKNLPFLVVTNDLDTSNYILGLHSPTYKKFRYSLAFEHSAIKKMIAEAEIPLDNIVVAGFPLRPNFFEEKSPTAIKTEFDIPANKPVVLLMMGAVGANTLLAYTKKICSIDFPLHLIVCVGRNEELRKKIICIEKKACVSVTTLGFTNRISDLMAISDLLISKPGPNAICEAIQMNLPLLLDNTNKHLSWEKFNLDFVTQTNIGELIYSYNDIPALIYKYISDVSLRTRIKKNMTAITQTNFATRIHDIVSSLLRL